LAPSTKWIYNGVRKLFPFFKEDFSASSNLQQVKEWMAETDIIAQFKNKI
jgi:histidine ammonia-lyase